MAPVGLPANDFFTFFGFHKTEIARNSSNSATCVVNVSHFRAHISKCMVPRGAARCFALRCGAGSSVNAALVVVGSYTTSNEYIRLGVAQIAEAHLQ